MNYFLLRIFQINNSFMFTPGHLCVFSNWIAILLVKTVPFKLGHIHMFSQNNINTIFNSEIH